MADPFVGEIRMFGGTYAPIDWLMCDGSLVSIASYSTLFAVLGTHFGGNGQTNFGLPDLRGRIPVGQGNGAGLTPRTLGESFGVENVTLRDTETGHGHTLNVSTSAGSLNDPITHVLGQSPAASGSTPAENLYRPDNSKTAALSTLTLGNSGQSQSHTNMMPSLGVNFIIAYNGIYPTQS